MTEANAERNPKLGDMMVKYNGPTEIAAPYDEMAGWYVYEWQLLALSVEAGTPSYGWMTISGPYHSGWQAGNYKTLMANYNAAVTDLALARASIATLADTIVELRATIKDKDERMQEMWDESVELETSLELFDLDRPG